MDDILSITEIRLIRSMLARKTDSDIAAIVGKPVEVISRAIEEMTGVIKRPKRKVKAGVKKRKAPVKRAQTSEFKLKQKLAEQRKKEENKRRLAIERARIDRLKRRMEAQRIPDRKLDLTGKVAVRLDHKTFVYVKPGTDIEALRKKLLKK